MHPFCPTSKVTGCVQNKYRLSVQLKGTALILHREDSLIGETPRVGEEFSIDGYCYFQVVCVRRKINSRGGEVTNVVFLETENEQEFDRLEEREGWLFRDMDEIND